MLLLGIETSCDETSVAIVRDGRVVLSNVIASSRKLFEELAGVIPEEAARRQVECMLPVLERALEESKTLPSALDAIAVTSGPGLLGSLLVGTTCARTLALLWKKPLIGVHHTLGHLSSPWLLKTGEAPDVIPFPILTLSASGGHSDLWLRGSHLRGTLLGRTRDDAAGEAFDKGASMLTLPYPGGPSISKEAAGGNTAAYEFPHPLHDDPSLDFSFAGLKTALRYVIRDQPSALQDRKNLAASYEHAICAHLLDRVSRALQHHPEVRELHIVGGVSANERLREEALALCTARGVRLRTPALLSFCTDNAAMIAAAGTFLLEEDPSIAGKPFETQASIPLTSVLREPAMPESSGKDTDVENQ